MSDDDVKVIYDNILSVPESHIKESINMSVIKSHASRVISSPRASIENVLSSIDRAPTLTIETAHKIKIDNNVCVKQHQENLEKSCDTSSPSIEPEENLFLSPSITRKRKSRILQHGTDSLSEKRIKRKLNDPRPTNSEKSTTMKGLSEGWETLTSVTNFIKHYDECLLKYLENHAKVVLDNYSNLINKEEEVMIKAFFSMDITSNYLYEECYKEKYKCRRFSEYQNNATEMKSISVLAEKKFLLTDAVNFDLVIVLDMMKIHEVKQLCESLGRKCTGRKKKDYVQDILCYSQLQSPSMLNHISTNDISKIASNIVGPCFILNPKLYGLFQRINFLYYLKCNEKEVNKGHKLLAETNHSVYPDYIIDRTARIFTCRDELLSFQIAIDLWIKFSERLKTKQWIQANIYLCTIRNNWSKLTKCSGISAPPLPLCLREYTSGSIYTYALYKGVEILKGQNQEQAIMDITSLLDKRTYLPYLIGQWYEQIISIHQASGQIEKVINVIDCAMKDSDGDLQTKYVLSCRIAEILKKKKGVSIEARKILQRVPCISSLKCKEASVIKTMIYRAGCNQLYVKEDENGGRKFYSSVEELVKDYYCPTLFKYGIYAGNNIISSLFGVLFWDMIYECPVPCAFINLYQTKPLDLTTGEFYRNRRASFDRRFFEMTFWNPDEIALWIKEICTKQKGRKSIVQWELFQDSDYILDIINCVGWNILLKICKRLAENYCIACNGFPELFTWTPGQKNQYKFVEVQHPKEKLVANRRMWRDFLLEVNAEVEICFIQVQQSQVTKVSVDSEQQLCANKESDEEGSEKMILPNTSHHML